MSPGYTGVRRGLNQLQDRSVTVTVPIFNEARSDYSDDALLIATIDQQGALLSSTRYDWPAADRPEPFDGPQGHGRLRPRCRRRGLRHHHPVGRRRRPAGEGLHYFDHGDAFDDKLLWAMVRGSSSVYKAQIRSWG